MALVVSACAAGAAVGEKSNQTGVPRVEGMPALPKPYSMKNWDAAARAFDKLAYDFHARGQYLPLIWWDNSRINMDRRGFGIPSYVGPVHKGAAHEAITTMGSVVGATFTSIDKAKGEHNWVLMCEQYYNKKNGQNLVLNRTNTRSGGSFWYDVFPHIMFYTLVDRYPGTGRMKSIMKTTADRWYRACWEMGGKDGKADFNHTGFDFQKMKPVDNGRWKEPDAAAGIAWLQYMAWVKFKDPKYLQAAGWCMQFLHDRKGNPYYEVQMPFGAYTAARMNAELGRSYDLRKFVNWCFDQSSVVRPDMGVISANWSGHDCHGLVGGINRPPHRKAGGGYAFAMNTFAMAWPMVPMVRYDDRYARAIGKWMLNAANAARLFYPDAHPRERQSCPGWKGDPAGAIAYEGLRHHWDGEEALVAGGDPVKHKWAYKTDYGVYGSSLSGVFGGIVRTTNQKYILQLDCLATDSFCGRAYPTCLYFNPYKIAKTVNIQVGAKPRDLYDAVRDEFVKKKVSGRVAVRLAADSAALLVIAPANGKLTRRCDKTLIDNVVVDFRNNASPKSGPASIIFDTDMDTDCDDAGALAMLHALADAGEVRILATVVSSKYAYSAPCVEAINRYYGRGELPIGVPKGAGAPTKRGSRYARQIAEAYTTRLTTGKDADNAVDVYRRTLAAQDDGSVVIVTVGYMTNLRDLLRSRGDKHSKLDGAKLVAAKVRRWVCMGGRYPANLRHGGYGNFMPDPGAIVEAAAKWPGTVYFSGLGGKVLTGRALDKTSADNPVRRAYELYLKKKNKPARPSWDQVALLFAVRPNASYWKLRRKGSNLIYANGTNRWVDKPDIDRHMLVEFTDDGDVIPTVIRAIEELMIRPPRRADSRRR